VLFGVCEERGIEVGGRCSSAEARLAREVVEEPA